MATNGNPKYLVNGYRANGLLSGFAYHDDAESMVRHYLSMVAMKREYGGRAEVIRCSDGQKIDNPENELAAATTEGN